MEMLRPEAGLFSRDAVYQCAADIARQLGYQPNGDIVAAIKKAGGSIEYKNSFKLDQWESDSIVIDDIARFQIILSAYSNVNRDRFTIAHELGHYVLHYYLRSKKEGISLGKMVCQRAGSGPVEWEANWFAAGFLMPENEFKRIHKEEDGEIELIAERFGVSRSAAEVRARSLGLPNN